jgi:hypothetical protein
LTKIAGSIVDESEKSAKMLKCGTDNAPAVVTMLIEMVKNELLV